VDQHSNNDQQSIPPSEMPSSSQRISIKQRTQEIMDKKFGPSWHAANKRNRKHEVRTQARMDVQTNQVREYNPQEIIDSRSREILRNTYGLTWYTENKVDRMNQAMAQAKKEFHTTQVEAGEYKWEEILSPDVFSMVQSYFPCSTGYAALITISKDAASGGNEMTASQIVVGNRLYRHQWQAERALVMEMLTDISEWREGEEIPLSWCDAQQPSDLRETMEYVALESEATVNDDESNDDELGLIRAFVEYVGSQSEDTNAPSDEGSWSALFEEMVKIKDDCNTLRTVVCVHVLGFSPYRLTLSLSVTIDGVLDVSIAHTMGIDISLDQMPMVMFHIVFNEVTNMLQSSMHAHDPDKYGSPPSLATRWPQAAIDAKGVPWEYFNEKVQLIMHRNEQFVSCAATVTDPHEVVQTVCSIFDRISRNRTVEQVDRAIADLNRVALEMAPSVQPERKDCDWVDYIVGQRTVEWAS
jgi:hypothetical protein